MYIYARGGRFTEGSLSRIIIVNVQKLLFRCGET